MYPSISADDYRVLGDPATGFSDEDFFQFCQRNPDLRIERTANHEIIIMPPAGFESSSASASSVGLLFVWFLKSRLGRVLESSVGYTLPDGAVLSPDASWVSPERLATVTPEQLQKFPSLCPDFIIEVKSPSDRIPTLQAKMEQWLNNGVRLGFLLDTETETAYVYRPNHRVEIVQGFENELSGEPVLSGFRLDLREIKA
ncbi:Uma2 family endonuclease [Hymenobacter rubidus]|uniref:Uma2 family endonuclease n=1 Tax=Hymenobacter rubidus TaxID=1441626 RepID=UPI00191D5AA7|nr:Uma2 family endonuclease [Hymenobacter rubidus]